MSDDVLAPRASRFREHTNTTNSIHPPPDELWRDIGIESLMEKFNDENQAPAKAPRPTARRSHSAVSTPARKASGASAQTPGDGAGTKRTSAVPALPVTPAGNEGTLGRFSRAFASVFGGLTGKRKAVHATIVVDAEAREKEKLDERKRAAEAAYYEAKELGLLPAAKVFVRPSVAARMRKDGMASHVQDSNSSAVSISKLTLGQIPPPSPPSPPPPLPLSLNAHHAPPLYITPRAKGTSTDRRSCQSVCQTSRASSPLRKKSWNLLSLASPQVPPPHPSHPMFGVRPTSPHTATPSPRPSAKSAKQTRLMRRKHLSPSMSKRQRHAPPSEQNPLAK